LVYVRRKAPIRDPLALLRRKPLSAGPSKKPAYAVRSQRFAQGREKQMLLNSAANASHYHSQLFLLYFFLILRAGALFRPGK